MSSQRSSNAQDARTDSEVRNVMEEKSKSEPMANNNEAAPGVQVNQILKRPRTGLDVLLSLITEAQHVNETKKKKGNLTGYWASQNIRVHTLDELGKEASENARVWKVYLDEAETFDDEMLKGFRDTLDALLVFILLKIRWGNLGFQPALKCYVDLDWNSIQAFIWDTLRRRDETDNHKVFKVLVENGADVNAGKGIMGLHCKQQHLGDLDIVKYLVEKGEMLMQREGIWVCIASSSIWGHLDIVKYLVEKGADVNAEGGFWFALQAAAFGDIWILSTAVYWGHLDIVKYLVEKGADVNAEGGNMGFIASSSRWGHLDIVKYLVEKGADVNAKEGIMGLHCKQQHIRDIWILSNIYLIERHLDIVKYLVEKGAYVNAKGGEYGFPLQAAAYMGRLDVVKYVVEEKSVDVNGKGQKYESAFKAAQEGDEPEVVKYLREDRATE
ncbi:hypothetical protein D9758_015768 [Tetrapyrgos nigripes]|uniref:DUF6535 domain-containing protein n=1 Tax=Tetrapyrgos nigripes TaxID=182062 RepID=A0A8H5CB78_9AGAR|nr:hypothetical protein D9758_015768 [Tetrapyrgos nigripes]